MLLSKERGIADGWEAVDIGSATIRLFEGEIEKAKRCSGMGRSEFLKFLILQTERKPFAEAVARSSAKSIIGGGDSVTGKAVRAS